MKRLASLLREAVDSADQKERDADSVREYGVVWRTTRSGKVIGIDPRTGAAVKGDPRVTSKLKTTKKIDNKQEVLDPKKRRSLFARIKEKLNGSVKKIKKSVVEGVKGELAEMKSVVTGLKALATQKKLTKEQKKDMINTAIHQALMFGLKGALYALVPPIAGMIVKQAVSTAAFRLIDAKIGRRFAGAEKTEAVEDLVGEFSDMVVDSLYEVILNLEKIPDSDFCEVKGEL